MKNTKDKCVRGHDMRGTPTTNENLTLHKAWYGWRRECKACRRLRSRRRYWLSRGYDMTDEELEEETGRDIWG